MADVYSLDEPRTFLYRHRNGVVTLDRGTASLTRDPKGQITSVTIGGHLYAFELDADGLIEKVTSR